MLGSASANVSTDYLTLLTIQLQHQDPTNPVDQQDLIGNLTQFSVIEGIENLNVSFADMLRLQEVSQGINLVDKNVKYADPMTGQSKTGFVSELNVDNNSIALMIENQRVPLNYVSGVVA